MVSYIKNFINLMIYLQKLYASDWIHTHLRKNSCSHALKTAFHVSQI